MKKAIAILSFGALGFVLGLQTSEAKKDDQCLPSGSKCKFGSSCCSKVCKASYTCK